MKICTVLEQRREALRAEYPFWTKKTLYDHPYLAEAVLSSGKADFVTMLRASLADPELPNKIRDGRIDEINYCIGYVSMRTQVMAASINILLTFLISEASDGFFESPPHRIPGKFLSAPYPGKNTHSALYRKSCVLHYQSRRHTPFPPEDQ